MGKRRTESRCVRVFWGSNNTKATHLFKIFILYKSNVCKSMCYSNTWTSLVTYIKHVHYYFRPYVSHLSFGTAFQHMMNLINLPVAAELTALLTFFNVFRCGYICLISHNSVVCGPSKAHIIFRSNFTLTQSPWTSKFFDFTDWLIKLKFIFSLTIPHICFTSADWHFPSW